MTLPPLLFAMCLPLGVEADRVTAGDLAPAVPGLAALPAGTALGYAPAPGSPRIFGPAELARLGRRFGIPLEPAGQVCVERPVGLLTPDQMLLAMRSALNMPGARVEVVDFSRHPVPQGRVEFPLATLFAPPPAQPNGLAMWRGTVRFGGNRQFGIWARVRILVRVERVTAIETLPAGRTIQASQVRLETGEIFPSRSVPLAAVEQAVGRVPRQTIPAGATLTALLLDAPYDVARGDKVHVEVSRGEARIAMDGVAQAPGHQGQMILVRNPANGKRFPARVLGPGKVAAGVEP